MSNHRIVRTLLFLCILSTFCLPATAKVEAIKGKRYRLSPQHGPWMILVAAISDVPDERRTDSGMSAWEAADALVYELRKLGIPAYTYQRKEKSENVGGSGISSARFIAQHEQIAVMAGNFSSPDTKQARLILDYLKHTFEPEFLKDQRNGGILPRTPGRPKPLNRAQMAPNPLMSQAQVNNRTIDPLVRQLNSGMDHSLLVNPGKYTLRVATLEGASIYQVGNKIQEKTESSFNKMFGTNLDAAGNRARELTQALRSGKRLGYGRDYEAWVFHERYESFVTIGSFDSRNDPRIAQLAKQFGAKTRMFQGKEVLTAETMTIPRNVAPGREPDKFWMFDVQPKLVEVPRIRR